MASKELEFGGDTYRLSYEILNSNQKDSILILHGWGADKGIMKKAFGDKLKNFKHIYLDLPGFGSSEISVPLFTKDYASITKKFLSSIAEDPSCILAHSFGGKVACLLKPANLVLLSSAGIVAKKPFGVRLKIALFKFLKKFGLGSLRLIFASKDVAGMNQVMYETFKNVVDEDFASEFKNTPSKALIFWGKNDKATPLKSGEIIASLIPSSQFFALDGDHFFFLSNSDFIAKTIEDKLKDPHHQELA